MNYRKWRLVTDVLGYAGLGMLLYVRLKYGMFVINIVYIVGMLLFLTAFIICVAKLRCPRCGHHIQVKLFGQSKFCPHCGSDDFLK